MSNKTRVLIVEDEALIAEEIRDRLLELGYGVPAVISSGEAAVEAVAQMEPDVILMDIRLEGEMDGVEAASQIRARFDIPVVYLTAYVDEPILERAKVTAPFGYILKPFRVRELQSNIEIALHKHALENKLRESESRYRIISELITDFAFAIRVRPDGSLEREWVTDSFIRLTGFSPKEIEAWGSLHSLVHPDDLSIIQEALQLLLSGQPAASEYRIITAGGEVCWLRSYARPEWDETEARVVRIVGAGQNITGRKQSEEAQRRYAERLEAVRQVGLEITAELELEALLHSIVLQAIELQEATGGGLFLYRPQQDLLEWIVSIGDDEMPPIGSVIHRDEGLSGKVWTRNAPMIVNEYRQWSGRSSNFDGYPLGALLGVPIRWREEFLGVLVVNKDIPGAFSLEDVELLELFAAQAAIAIKNARLYEQTRQAAETKAMLLQEVNHRVKNNLMGIIGMLYATRRYVQQEQSHATDPTLIDDLIQRIEGLVTVHRLLSAAEWSPLPLHELATEVIRAVLLSLPFDKRVSMEIETADSVRVTPKQAGNLAIVINELTTNTIKYGLLDRHPGRITVCVAQDGKTVLFEHRDNGPGYPESVLRLKDHSVGLYLVQSIVGEALHGKLELHNDNGAVATIRFPANGAD